MQINNIQKSLYLGIFTAMSISYEDSKFIIKTKLSTFIIPIYESAEDPRNTKEHFHTVIKDLVTAISNKKKCTCEHGEGIIFRSDKLDFDYEDNKLTITYQTKIVPIFTITLKAEDQLENLKNIDELLDE